MFRIGFTVRVFISGVNFTCSSSTAGCGGFEFFELWAVHWFYAFSFSYCGIFRGLLLCDNGNGIFLLVRRVLCAGGIRVDVGGALCKRFSYVVYIIFWYNATSFCYITLSFQINEDYNTVISL